MRASDEAFSHASGRTTLLQRHDAVAAGVYVVRRFGRIAVTERDDHRSLPTLATLGPEPLGPGFTGEHLHRALALSSRAVKTQLLSQRPVAGVGNIYADEALWRARLRGTRLTDSISRAKLVELLGHARDVMAEALAVGGTSFDELYVNVNGESGYFARSLNAYGREGEPCYRCGSTMRREQFMNRSSFYCAHCQRSARGR